MQSVAGAPTSLPGGHDSSAGMFASAHQLLDELTAALGEDHIFFGHLLLVVLGGFLLFVLDANPGNSGYVCSHFVFPEDSPYDLWYNLQEPSLDVLTKWLFAPSWIWPTRANLKTKEVEPTANATANNRRSSFMALEAREKGRKYAASPTFCSKVPPKAGAVLVEKEKKQHYTMLPRTDCEFQQFPPHKLDTDMWFKVRVIWGYLKIAAFAVIKENLWFVQWLFKLDPGYSYFTRDKRTGFQALYIEHAYQMYEDCWNRPICSAPASTVEVVFRERKDQKLLAPYQPVRISEKSVKCVNLGSYNYLGFGGVDEYCTPLVARCIRDVGLSTGSTRGGSQGTNKVHKELETKVASFLDKEDAFVIGMGFATNSTIIPCLIDPEGNGKGCLIFSDELNHKSIIEGVRMSSVTVKAFAHNDMVDLEQKLKHACDVGQPNGAPWRKILVIVEGIYSMEGDFARLREIVALKDKYGALLYLDEAHSIGAVGVTGRGITELMGVPREKVDVMMGTFTKSFGSAGGYIAADKAVIANLRKNSPNATFAPSMSPACAAQALAALDLLGEARGKNKIRDLRRNSNHFRRRLAEIGFWVLGDEDSPVVPVLMDQESMWYFSVNGMKLGVAIVVVCAPATPYMLPRARFCVSAAHTMQQIDDTLAILEKLGNQLGILFRKRDPCLTNQAYYKWLREAPLSCEPYSKKPQFEPLGSVDGFVELPVVEDLPLIAAATPTPAFPGRAGRTRSVSSADDSMSSSSSATNSFAEAGREEEVAEDEEPAEGVDVDEEDTSSSGIKGNFKSGGSSSSTSGARRRRRARNNFGTLDPLGMIQDAPARLPDLCDEYMSTHGFGTCGPRGFYGTTMEHLALEKSLNALLETEYAIFFAQGVSVASSVLASPLIGAKDLVFCFGKCHYGIKSGLRLNGKCTLVFVEDMQDLEIWLQDWRNVERIDREKVGFREDAMLFGSLPDRFGELEREIVPLDEYSKRFVVAEGLYQCDGSLCELEHLARLKDEFRLQLIVDETLSLGGVAPRGVCEFFGMKPSVIDVYLGSLEFAVGSVGGFCAGQGDDRHLRLTASGYCFSASAPGVSCLWSKEVVEDLGKVTKQLGSGRLEEAAAASTANGRNGSFTFSFLPPGSRAREEREEENALKLREAAEKLGRTLGTPSTSSDSGAGSSSAASSTSSCADMETIGKVQDVDDESPEGSLRGTSAAVELRKRAGSDDTPGTTVASEDETTSSKCSEVNETTSAPTMTAATTAPSTSTSTSMSYSRSSGAAATSRFQAAVPDRVRQLSALTEHLQTAARRFLSQKYEVRGDSYVLHLKPKILVASAASSGDSDSDSAASVQGSQGAGGMTMNSNSSSNGNQMRQFSVHSLTRKSVCERTRVRYQKALEEVQARTGLDIFERPLTERALDTRMSIHTEWTPTLRIAISCLHSPKEIDELLLAVRNAATW
mmetsp:Transcript_28675/g.72603  ORF Transcript_28675/g.72603 Transcript_28675/m.72603 type:complete len:1444 (-) Transcript_28675:1091-5422(-)